MRPSRTHIILGIIFIFVGLWLMAENLGLMPSLPLSGWGVVLGVVSVLSLVAYLTSGGQSWGWLFPALICGGLAGVTVLEQSGADNQLVGSVGVWSIAAPFWAVLLLAPNRHWWPVIPGAVLTAAGVTPLVTGEAAAGVMLGSLAFSFVVVYLFDRQRNRWALIPAGVMLFAGVIVMLETWSASEDMIGVITTVIFGTIFLGVFLMSSKQWWALIVAGVFYSSSLAAGVALLPPLVPVWAERLPNVLFLGGMALTFGWLWLLRGEHATGWARYPAAVLGVLAVFAALLGEVSLSVAGPLLIIVLGVWLLLRAMSPRRAV